MVTQTTERGSVFDVGALFEIPGHDVNRAVFRHVLYSKLGETEIWQSVRNAIKSCEHLDDAYRTSILNGALEQFCSNGASTHHLGMLDAETGEMVAAGLPKNPSAFNVVRRFEILKPERIDILGSSLFDYSIYSERDGFVVPLEFIVRFGITSASSVYRKYLEMDGPARKKFEIELGAKKPLEAWQYLDRPVSDYTTKFEPTDRMLTRQEAVLTSCVSGELFRKGTEMSVLGAWAVRQLVEPLGLSMWDIKWEFAKDKNDLVYVDTIDTDSFRATLKKEFDGRQFLIHCNKQAMRDYFQILHDDWIKAIKESKQKGDQEGCAFTEILKAGQEAGTYAATPAVEAEFIDIQERKMTAICDYLLGKIDAQAAATALDEESTAELTFYQKAGKLDALSAANGVD